MYIPTKLSKSVENRWGDKGVEWLETLPAIVEKCERHFEISVNAPFENAYANFVVNAEKKDGEKVVLKIGYPTSEIHTEIQALDAFNGNKAVRILDRDDDICTVLLEKIEPGYDLTTVKDDEEATKIASVLFLDLAAEPPTKHSLPTMTDWLDVFNRIGKDHDIPSDFIEKAKETHHKFETIKTSDMVLHGDLHHENILFDSDRGWLAIDPQGVIGDPVCEVGAFFYNPDGISKSPNLEEIYLKRAQIICEVLQTDLQHVIGRAFVQSVISCGWSVEDNDKWDIVCVKTLEKLLDSNS